MSDFDKEAEREKLRERFAEDEEKRKTTERMSELLLQGATMTNTHCDTCGDPLFRYDGQTFCPTCQRAAAEGETTETTAASDEPAPEHATDDGQRIAVDDPHDQPTDRNDDTRSHTADTAENGRPDATPTRGRRAPPSQTASDTTDAEKQTYSRETSGESTNDLAAAETSLSRTLRQLASKAETTDDLGRTREHLAAAREAAEALEAVRKARQTR